MSDLSAFPITKKWPAAHPERIQLYSLPTPNGVKVSIMLEETGLPYEPHLVRFDTNDQMTPEFLSVNPNNKIPAIIDPHGPDDKPLPLFESGAILLYLADKSGQLIPRDAAGVEHVDVERASLRAVEDAVAVARLDAVVERRRHELLLAGKCASEEIEVFIHERLG